MNKLRFYRLECQLTQIELAEASQIPRWRIQQHEEGIALLPFAQMEKVAAALGVDPEKIFGGRANSLGAIDEI